MVTWPRPGAASPRVERGADLLAVSQLALFHAEELVAAAAAVRSACDGEIYCPAKAMCKDVKTLSSLFFFSLFASGMFSLLVT